ncbi:MAG: tetratricopeptide repeat protein [Lachnospiraceae bacterium]|nr:tetratricopeptide repeat protein [Lachnospiraceae bacterium]
MICPNCENEISFNDTVCDQCGIDLELIRTLVSWSNIYYNEGLERARVRNLTGAIESLRRSLKFYKYNINARNLLGLIYHEMGETGSALTEWVISSNYKSGRNPAVEYVKEIQSDKTALGTIDRNLKKYNTSLEYARNGDTDLAIIQLKKLVNANPKYVQAANLLAVLYIRNGRKEGRLKAYKLGRSVLDIDKANVVALSYMKELDDVREKARSRRNDQNKAKESKENTVKKNSSLVEDDSVRVIVPYQEEKPTMLPVLQVLGGMILGLLVMAFLIQPTIDKYRNKKNNNDFVTYSEDKAADDSEMNLLKEENEDLTQQVADLELQVSELQGGDPTDIANYKKMFEALIEAKQLYDEGDYISAAKKLKKVDTKELDSKKATKLYKSIQSDTYVKASESYCLKGIDAYNGTGDYIAGHDYEAAIEELLKALEFNEENTDAMYYLGRCYQLTEDTETALEYYNTIVNDYPDARLYNDAASRLREMGY